MTSAAAVWDTLRHKLSLWRDDPEAFVREAIGAEPTHHQRQLLKAIAFNNAVAVRSGHGTGKSACLSWLVLWFLLTRPSAKVVCTAPTRRQLFDVLWAEITLWKKRAKVKPLFDLLEIQSETIRLSDRKDWFARAVAVNVQQSAEEQAEALAGYHAEHLLCIVDEASGLPDPVFRPIEGYMTQEDNKVVLAGNPTRPEGYFYRIFKDAHFGAHWVKLHWSSVDSPLVSQQWIELMKSRYGEDSVEFKIRVLGEFPELAERQLIPVEWVRRAVVSEIPTHILDGSVAPIWGVDVARFGSDETAIVSRLGNYVEFAKSRHGLDTIGAAEWVMEEIRNADLKPRMILVDVSGGHGAGVADLLRAKLGAHMVIDVNVGWSAFEPDKFRLLRDELWWRVRTAFEMQSLFIPPNEKLIRQLTSVSYKHNERGKVVVESKESLKSRKGLPSPDLADALCLTYYIEAPIEFAPSEQKLRRRYASSWRVV